MAKDDTPAAVGNIKRAPVPGTLYMGTYYLVYLRCIIILYYVELGAAQQCG